MNNLSWMPAYLQMNVLSGLTAGTSAATRSASMLSGNQSSSPMSLFEQLLLNSLTGGDGLAAAPSNKPDKTTPETILFNKLTAQPAPINMIPSSPLTSDKNYESMINKAANTYHVDPKLIQSIIKHESNGNPLSTSASGAQGLMQLMPATARSLGVTDSYNPEQNILGGTKYIKQLLDQFNGNETLAVAAYNAGPGNVMKYNGVPPFNETQNYVQKVLGSYYA